MRHRTTRLIVWILVIPVLIAPTRLLAMGRRGAAVVVTRNDGALVEGELIAVKGDSLLLLDREGRDESVSLAEVKAVRIVRRSRPALLTAAGGAAGLAVLGGFALAGGGDVEIQAKHYLHFGGAGALAGLLMGLILGADSTFAVAGIPESDVSAYWDKLSAHSREGRRMVLAPSQQPAVARPAEAKPRRTPRIRIALAASIPISPHGYRSSIGEGWFEFGDVYWAPPDPHPIAVAFSQEHRKQLTDIWFGPASLAYDLTARTSLEAEVVHSGQARVAGSAYGEMDYISFPEGLHYSAWAGGNYHTSFTSLLAGLSFRTKPPSALDRHIFEVGAAAGAALGTMTLLTLDGGSQGLAKIAPSGKIHAAYDFYVLPKLSLGAIVGYRYLRIDFPSATYTAEVEFHEAGNESNTVTRPVVVTVPGQTVRWPGPFFGFRLGIRI
jgi:hypothetical protein